MPVTITRSLDAVAYDPPGHVGVTARRLQGQDAGPADSFWVGRSDYPPGAEAERAPAKQETVYVVVFGQLTLTVRDGADENTTLLLPGDSVRIPPGTERRVINEANNPAQMLVVAALPR